jgi:hypothetical protein
VDHTLYIKTESLFNFLCYLQSIDDQLIKPPKTMPSYLQRTSGSDNLALGCLIGEVFYTDKIGAKLIIERFYPLLKCKKNAERNIKVTIRQKKLKEQRDQIEIFKPKINRP